MQQLRREASRWFGGLAGASVRQLSNGVGVDYLLFIVAFTASGLGAYSLGFFPYQWLAFGLAFAALVEAARARTLAQPPVTLLLYLLLLTWAGAVTLFQLNAGEWLWPEWRFALLRICKIAGFAVVLWCTYTIVRRYSLDVLADSIVTVGVVMSVVALYYYFAQLNGWPELPRNRPGVTGGDQAVVFTYPFHRLLGTFLEPSLFADWMLLPMFLAWYRLRDGGRWWDGRLGVILGAVLLTGSIAAYSALAAAFATIAILWLAKRTLSLTVLCNLVLGVAILLSCLQGYKHTNGYHIKDTSGFSSIELLAVMLAERFGSLVGEGVTTSNRGYLYKYSSQTPVSATGEGLGIANLKLAEALDSKQPASFLNLYLAMLFGAGWIGLALLGSAMAWPLLRIARWSTLVANAEIIAMYAAYLVMFLAVADELTFSFAVVVGIVSTLGPYSDTAQSRKGVDKSKHGSHCGITSEPPLGECRGGNLQSPRIFAAKS